MTWRNWNVKKLGCEFLAIRQLYSASLRDRYQATGTVKDRRRSGQPGMATGVKMAIYVDCVLMISILAGYYQSKTYSRASRVICF